MKKYILTIFLLVLTFTIASSQTIVVKGKIMDNTTREPVFGANVIVENTEKGVTTDEQGNFVLTDIEENSNLKISYLGYITEVVQAGNKDMIIYLKLNEDQLEEVVISASRTQQRREEVPVAISIIPALKLEEMRPTSIDQVLNQAAGVLMVDLGNEQHMMSIRQPISTKSLFLYLEDGVPIRPTGVFNHNALLEMNMAATKNIEIIRGPYSSLYGSEAIGGAINFFIANPTATPYGKFSISGNEHGYSRYDGMASTTFGKTGVYISGYHSRIKDGIREYGDYDKTAITAKITHSFSEKAFWSNTLTYVDYFSEMSGSLDETKFLNKDYSSYHTFTYRDAKALRFNSTLNYNWNDANNTIFTLVFRDNSMGQNPSYRIDSRADFDSYTPGQINDNSFNSYGFIGQHNLNVGKWKLNFGTSLDFSPNTYEALETEVYRNSEGMFDSYTLTGDYLSNYDVDIFNLGAYVAAEYQVSDDLILNAAFRLDNISYDFTNKLGDDAPDYKAPSSKNTFTAFTPRLGAIYNISRGIGLYANYSNGFLPPSVGELYRKSEVPLLDPSKFNNYEIGSWLSFLDNKIYIDLAAYYLKGKDEVVSVTIMEDGVSKSENRNAGETKHYGLEYLLRIKPVDQFNFRISGSYSKHEYTDFVTKIVDGEPSVDYSGNEMKGAPAWVNNAELSYYPNFAKGLRMSLEWQHVGEYYTDDSNKNTYEGYDVFNARLGYKRSHWQIWVNILNIADDLYATKADTSWGKTTYTPGNPRTFNIGIEFNLFRK